jgi:hypothetical protein
MSEEKCPCCPNHCSKDNLGCGRGKNYFNNNLEEISLNEKVISDLRKCGHLLHHNSDLDTESLLANFSEVELKSLHNLLTKFLNF